MFFESIFQCYDEKRLISLTSTQSRSLFRDFLYILKKTLDNTGLYAYIVGKVMEVDVNAVRLQFVKLNLPDIVFRSMTDCSKWVSDHNLPFFATQNMTDAMNRKKRAGKPVKFYIPEHEEYIIWLMEYKQDTVASVTNEAVTRFVEQKIAGGR